MPGSEHQRPKDAAKIQVKTLKFGLSDDHDLEYLKPSLIRTTTTTTTTGTLSLTGKKKDVSLIALLIVAVCFLSAKEAYSMEPVQ
jgi:hypothetical protein